VKLPTEFTGLWERTGLWIDGVFVPLSGRAFWFQGLSAFVDVREGSVCVLSEAFAGTTTWTPADESIFWSHDIDLRADQNPDLGRVEWRSGDIVEHGTTDVFGVDKDFTEIWRRRSDPGDPMVIADRVDGTGRLAVTGDSLAVLLGNGGTGVVRAGMGYTVGGRWSATILAGFGFAPGSRAAPIADGDDHLVFLDEQWRVAERT
jgi:hypothetical protein